MLSGAKGVHARFIRRPQILLHLLHGAHAAQHHAHLRLVPQPLQSPLGRSPLDGLFLHRLQHLLRRIGQPSAQQRLHHHHPQTQLRRQHQSTRARLVLRVHVVVLNLAELPQIGAAHDLLKAFVLIVEGESDVPDQPVGLCFRGLVQQLVLQHNVAPARTVQRVHQVEVNVIRLQLLQLLAQHPVKILRSLHHPHRQLGGHLHPLAKSSRQRLAQHHLALPRVIWVGGVKVIHAALNGATNHGNGFVLQNVRTQPLPVARGKPHTAKTQSRTLPLKLAKIAVLHLEPLL